MANKDVKKYVEVLFPGYRRWRTMTGCCFAPGWFVPPGLVEMSAGFLKQQPGPSSEDAVRNVKQIPGVQNLLTKYRAVGCVLQ